MKGSVLFVVMIGVLLAMAPTAPALAGWGDVLKSAGQAAVQTAVVQLTPQAQTAVDQAKQYPDKAQQESFLMTQAKDFLAAKNYQPALDLANYVITNLNAKSLDAQHVIESAKAALAKLAQEKLAQAQQANAAVQQGQAATATAQQVKTDAAQTANSVKSLFGATK